MDKFDQLQTFVRVVESGGISAAADRIGIAKSAVSRRLQELENRLDVQLLQRTTRRLHLTDAGREFYQRSLRILEELEEAELSLQSGQQALGGRLHINAPLSLGVRHLLPLIEQLQQEHPELAIDLDLDDRQVNLVEEGVDLLLRVGKLADSSLVARRLCPVHLLYCASPDYLERHGEPGHPEELRAHLGIGYTLAPENLQWQLGGEAGRTTPRPQIRLSTNNGDMNLRAVEAGLGIAAFPTFICHEAVEAGRVVPILRDYRSPPMQLYALYRSRRHLPQRVRVLLDALQQWLGELPPWDRGLQAYL